MAKRCVILAVVVLVASWGLAAGADDGSTLVFTDGTTMPVKSMAIKGTFVEVTLPTGAIQRYEAEFVDLVASGLVAPKKETQEEAANATGAQMSERNGRFSGAIAKGEGGGVKITDKDVGHVRPGAGQDAETKDEAEPGAGRASLAVTDLKQEISPGLVTLNGNVKNTGTVPVTAITIAAQATGADGKAVGRATTSLSQTLAADGSAPFSISVATSGTATNVHVSATATLSEFKLEKVENPEGSEGSSEEQP